MNLITKN